MGPWGEDSLKVARVRDVTSVSSVDQDRVLNQVRENRLWCSTGTESLTITSQPSGAAQVIIADTGLVELPYQSEGNGDVNNNIGRELLSDSGILPVAFSQGNRRTWKPVNTGRVIGTGFGQSAYAMEILSC